MEWTAAVVGQMPPSCKVQSGVLGKRKGRGKSCFRNETKRTTTLDDDVRINFRMHGKVQYYAGTRTF